METFRGATEPFQLDLPLWPPTPSEHLPPRPDSDLIRPDSDPKSAFCPNQVEIRSGPNQVWGEVFETRENEGFYGGGLYFFSSLNDYQ